MKPYWENIFGTVWCNSCGEYRPLREFRMRVRNGVGQRGRVIKNRIYVDTYCNKHTRKRSSASYRKHLVRVIEYRTRDDVKKKHSEIEKVRRNSVDGSKKIKEYESRPDILERKARQARERRAKNPSSRIRNTIRARIYSCLKGNKGRGTFAPHGILPYSVHDLKSWDNYGTKWHIDHIIPLSSFDLSGGINSQELRAAHELPNLRPLWAIENQKKHSKRILLI